MGFYFHFAIWLEKWLRKIQIQEVTFSRKMKNPEKPQKEHMVWSCTTAKENRSLCNYIRVRSAQVFFYTIPSFTSVCGRQDESVDGEGDFNYINIHTKLILTWKTPPYSPHKIKLNYTNFPDVKSFWNTMEDTIIGQGNITKFDTYRNRSSNYLHVFMVLSMTTECPTLVKIVYYLAQNLVCGR